jgi:hypothetical protein
VNPDAPENAELGFLHFSRCFGVAALHGPRSKKSLAGSQLEMLLPVVQRAELLEWGAIVVGGITATDPATLVLCQRRETTRPVKVQIGIESNCAVKNRWISAACSAPIESVADVLAHDRSVLAFHQRVVGRTAGARLGELDQPFVHQPGDAMVQELAAVVGVEAGDLKRELVRDRFQHRKHVPFADGFHAAQVLPLRHGVDRIDVVNPRFAVPVALMNRVHAQESGLALRLGFAPFADVDCRLLV